MLPPIRLRSRPYRAFESGGGFYLVKGDPQGGVARKKGGAASSPDAVKVPDASSSSGISKVMPSSTHAKAKSSVSRAMVPGLLEGGSPFSRQGPAAGGAPAKTGGPFPFELIVPALIQ